MFYRVLHWEESGGKKIVFSRVRQQYFSPHEFLRTGGALEAAVMPYDSRGCIIEDTAVSTLLTGRFSLEIFSYHRSSLAALRPPCYEGAQDSPCREPMRRGSQTP